MLMHILVLRPPSDAMNNLASSDESCYDSLQCQSAGGTIIIRGSAVAVAALHCMMTIW